MENPLLTDSKAPFGAPEFDKIKTEHFKPAFEAAIEEAKGEIEAIAGNSEEPTFANTVEALEYAGMRLNSISEIFFNLNSACTSPQMQELAEEISPSLTEYSMSILLNPRLFERVKAVYDNCDRSLMSAEQIQLLDKCYRNFARNGANLSEDDKAAFSKVEEELSVATLQFGKNVLSATNAFTLELTDESLLAGLPQYVKEMAGEEAASRGKEGWVFTLNAPSYGPFMKYSENRELREKMWRAYNTKCVSDQFDNTGLCKKIASLRLEEANILGYRNYADYSLEEKMAKKSETVNGFLEGLYNAAYPFALKDVEEIRTYAAANGFSGELMPWDFSYWSEKFQNEKYALNEELLKPYFELGSVQAAIFDLAGRLYGLNFKENKDIPVYHPDVKAFEVTDSDGRFMAVLYLDYFPRESKRGGAWMTEYRGQGIVNGVDQRPFVSVVTNFTKPTSTEPSLLTFYEVTTILHEFGHALHGMLSECTYPSLSSPNVDWDFVELPSQIMENWAYESEYLASFAKHYKTGEVIPQELIDKIIAAKNYLSGYACIRQLNYGTVDMAWHTLTSIPETPVVEFEQNIVNRRPIMPSVDSAVFSPQLTHVFSGGYAAGYYSYKWAEVLEADAFSLFKETGIFNKETAAAFRDKILSRGGTVDADVLFRDFRGRDPRPDALLEKMGMK